MSDQWLSMYPDYFEINCDRFYIKDYTVNKFKKFLLRITDVQFKELFAFKMLRYYSSITKNKASLQHEGCRGVTKQRNGKGVTYGMHKSLIIQLRNMQDDAKFELTIKDIDFK